MALSPDSSRSPLKWKFSQVFGERASSEEVQDVDIISAIGFDKTGDYLAVGDRGGRVVIFERKDRKDTSNNHTLNKLDQLNRTTKFHPEYQYKTEFQSHEPEFDYLKSLEIEEKINKVRWCATPNGAHFILSTNDKTIKLWKIKEHKVKKVEEVNPIPLVRSENALLAERSFISREGKPSRTNGYYLEQAEKDVITKPPSQDLQANVVDGFENASCARCRKVYAHAHEFNINSVSNNSDGETFISADDLRINLWNLDYSQQCFNIIDMKPQSMEDLTEVITSAEFHPMHCNLLAYSSSRGFIRLVDMRQSALCDHSAVLGPYSFQDKESASVTSFFTEIIASISDIKFTNDGRYILSRDYMNLKLWDMRMDSSPVTIFKVHEHLRPRLCELYDNDSIFDKFECCVSPNEYHFATGTYSNLLRTYSYGFGNEDGITIEATKHPYRKPLLHSATRTRRSSLSNLTRGFFRQNQSHENSISSSKDFGCDLSSKLLHMAWHPTVNLIACGAGSSLFIYYA